MSEITENTQNEDLNEVVEEVVEDSPVMTVPIDDTLSISGEAADAKAVGDALALKADRSELQTQVNVNGQSPDSQGLIVLLAQHVPMSDAQGAQTVAQAIAAAMARTGADIPIDDSQGAETIAQAINIATGRTADNIKVSGDSDAKTVAEVLTEQAAAILLIDGKTGSAIKLNTTDTTTIAEAIAALDLAAVKRVNMTLPDANGNVEIVTVRFAENLTTEDTKQVSGTFDRRTTAGSESISDGNAWLNKMLGNSVHTGFVEEVLEMTVTPVPRPEPEGEGEEEEEEITAEIDRDVFVAYVSASRTVNLYYTTEWSEDPELYGITVTGTPIAGDHIRVVYVKEERGTITQAAPSALVGTGWNLYERTNGYAHVVKYSDTYGYKIGGTYTGLTFKERLTDSGTVITPDANGLFNITTDGYVIVAGGSTDTYIYTTWGDWIGGPVGGFKAYTESRVNLATIMQTCFPYGLMKVGTVQDEINRGTLTAISRVQRVAYSAEARSDVEQSGLQYEFDENWIYFERDDPVVTSIQLVGEYEISEHGLEYIDGTSVPVYCEILYGENLKDKLRRDVVTVRAQSFSAAEKAQARTNIGAAAADDVATAITKTRADIGIVEDGDKATHAIAKDQYVIWKGDLYKASQAIPVGTTLSTSNLTAKTSGLGEEVRSLNTAITPQHVSSIPTTTGVYYITSSITIAGVTIPQYTMFDVHSSVGDSSALAVRIGSSVSQAWILKGTNNAWTYCEGLALNSQLTAKFALTRKATELTHIFANVIGDFVQFVIYDFKPDDDGTSGTLSDSSLYPETAGSAGANLHIAVAERGGSNSGVIQIGNDGSIGVFVSDTSKRYYGSAFALRKNR